MSTLTPYNHEESERRADLKRVLEEETVCAITATPMACIDPETPVRVAVGNLRSLGVSSLLVTEAGNVVGIFTERDVLEKVAERFDKLADAPVRRVMTPHPVVVYESDPAGCALSAIAAAGYRHVPVLDLNNKLVGILSPRRVFAFLESRLDRASA